MNASFDTDPSRQLPGSSPSPRKSGEGKTPRAKRSPIVTPSPPVFDEVNVVEQDQVSTSGNGGLHVRIAERAYEFYYRRGGHHGEDLRDWLAAEQEILKEAAR